MSKIDPERAREIEEWELEQQRKFTNNTFRIVRKELTAHRNDPSLTIRPDGLICNQACINKMENIVFVKMLVRFEGGDKLLAFEECDENYRNAFRWCVLKPDGKRKSRKISCSSKEEEDSLTTRIYKLMDWDRSKRYKMLGAIIKDPRNGKPAIQFDLTMKEVFPLKAPRRKKTIDEATQKAENISALDAEHIYSKEELTASIGETVSEEEARRKAGYMNIFSEPER